MSRTLRGLAPLLALLVLGAGSPAGAWLTTVTGDAPAVDQGRAIAKSPDGNLVVAGTVLERGRGTVLAVSKLSAGGESFWRRDVATDPVGFNEGRVISVGDVAVHTDGDVAVTGTAPGTPRADLVVARLDGASGTPRWSVRIGGGRAYSHARDVVFTPSGDVVVAGSLSDDETSHFTVIQLDGTDGSEEWRFTWAGLRDGNANALDIATDGDVVVAGRLRNDDDDFAVAKLDGQTGEYRWRRIIGDAGGYDEAYDVAADVDGSVYVAGGISPQGGQKDFAVVRLNAAGDAVWTSSFDGGASSSDEAYALALGPGFVAATGYTVTTFDTMNDFTIARFKATTGEIERRITLGDPIDDFTNDDGYAVTVDAEAAIIAAGRWGRSAFAIRVRENGTRAWERRIDGEPMVYASDALEGVVLASDGDPLVVGTLTRPENDLDFVVGRLDASDGSDVWQTFFDGTGTDSFDFGSAVTLDANDDVIAGGGVEGRSFGPDFTVVKTDGRSGDILWQQTLGTSGREESEWVRDVATTETGDVLAGGTLTTEAGPTFTVVKLAGTDGAERWRSVVDGGEANWGDGANAVAVAPNGDVVAAGQTTGPSTGADFTVVRLTPTGVERWRALLTPALGGYDDYATSLVVSPSGDIVAAGVVEYELSGVSAFTVAKLAPDSGEELWRASGLDAEGEPREGVALGLALDVAGNAAAAGTIQNADGNYEGVLLSFDAATGTERWRFTLPSEGTESSVLQAVEVVPGGDVIAAGLMQSSESNATLIVVRLDGTDGHERWRRLFTAPEGFEAGAPDVALGGGDVLLSGIVGRDLLLVRLDDETGADVWQRPSPQPFIGYAITSLVADDDGNPVLVSSFANPGSGTDLSIQKVSVDTGGEVICGDGVRDASEACDDGNRVDGDCCSAACAVEERPVCAPDDPDPDPDDPDDPVPSCHGEKVPPAITRGIAKAERLLKSADEETKPGRVARLTRRAGRILSKTTRLIERAAKARRRKAARISADCAASLRGVVSGLQESGRHHVG